MGNKWFWCERDQRANLGGSYHWSLMMRKSLGADTKRDIELQIDNDECDWRLQRSFEFFKHDLFVVKSWKAQPSWLIAGLLRRVELPVSTDSVQYLSPRLIYASLENESLNLQKEFSVSHLTAALADKGPMATVTLWRCSKCSSFISVESIRAIRVTICPACQHAPLDLCSSYNHVLDLRGEDDTCCDFYPHGWW